MAALDFCRYRLTAVFATVLYACAPSVRNAGVGSDLLARGQYAQAEKQYRQEINQKPQSAPALVGLGLALTGMERFADAEATLKKAQSLTDDDDVTLAMANLRTRQGRAADAMTLCQTLIDKTPDAASPRYCLGAAAHQAGKLTDAVAALRAALERDPQFIDAHFELAAVETQLEQRDEAIAELKRGLRANPTGSPPRLARLEIALGDLYEASKRYEEARYSYEHAQRYDNTNIDAVAGIGRSLRLLGRLDDALNVLKPAVKIFAKDARVHAELATVYRDYQLRPQALAEAKLALQLDSKRGDCYLLLISTLDPLQDASDENLRLLDQAGAILTQDFDLQSRLGEASIKRQRWQTAIVAYKRAITIKPADPKAHYGLGVAQLRSGDFSGARNAYTALEQLDADKAKDLLAQVDAASPPPKHTGDKLADALQTTTGASTGGTTAAKTMATTKTKATSKSKSSSTGRGR